MLFIKYLLILMTLLSVQCFPNRTIDSLQIVLAKTFDSNKKIRILNLLAGEYRRVNPKKGLLYAEEALKISVETGNKKEQVNSLIIIGIINQRLGFLEKAIENNLKALSISEKIKNDTLISLSYNNLGNIYHVQKKYTKAIDFYKRSLNLEKKIGNKEQTSIRYYNIGAIYETMDSIDTAIEYYKFSLVLEKELNNGEGIFYALYGIAGIETARGNTSLAEKSINEALHLAFQMGDDVGKMLCYSEKGNISNQRKDFLNAVEFFRQSLYYADKLNYKNEAYEAMLNISNSYRNWGNADSALVYLLKSTEIKDSIISQEDNGKIAEMEARYESEKKEQKIKEQDMIIAKEEAAGNAKDAQQLILVIIVVFMAFGAFMIYRNNRVKNKVNKQLQEKNKQIHYSLTYAKKIQRAILPSDERMKRIFHNSFILFEPRDIVSGDFYWVTCIEKRIIFALADCTGHGVPGAFMSMIGNTLLNEIVIKQKIIEPSEILSHLNKGIIHALNQKTSNNESQDDGMDITVCSFDHNFTGMKIALANHHAMLIRNGEVTEIEGDIFAIGGSFSVKGDINYTQQTIPLKQDDRIYFYTDGFKDQTGGEKKELYGMKRFKKFLLDTSDHEPLLQKEALHNEFIRWKGNGKQIDDVLIVGIKT